MRFAYTALDELGKKKSGFVEANDQVGARNSLVRTGLKPVTIKKAGSSGGIMELLSKGGKVKPKDLVIFTRQLATMINAGVPLVRSLATLNAQTENPAFKKILTQVSKDVEGGMAFADALEKHKASFNTIFINMIRAGEAGGILDEILKKLAVQQEKDAAIRAKFKGAMVYPTVLIGITVIVFIALMTLVVPKVGTIIADLSADGELPPMTKVMLGISDFLIGFWYIHLSVFVGGSFLLRRYIKTDKGRVMVDKYGQTNVPGFYAIGDCAPGQALAHVASKEAIITVENIGYNEKKYNHAIDVEGAGVVDGEQSHHRPGQRLPLNLRRRKRRGDGPILQRPHQH